MKTSNPLPKELVDKLPKDWPFKVIEMVINQNADAFSEAEVSELHRALRARDVRALFTALETCSPQSMTAEDNPLKFRVRYLVASLFKKYPFSVPGVDKTTRRDAAIEKFIAAEASCAWFNRTGYKNALAANERDPELWGFLDIMQDVIGRVLGKFEYADLVTNCRFGPGASLATVGNQVTSFYKFAHLPYTVSDSARAIAHDYIEGDDRWFRAIADDIFPGRQKRHRFPRSRNGKQELRLCIPTRAENLNRVGTVPKTWSIDRTIATEPLMNVMLQLGVDGWVRSRLKRWGVNLDDQSKNQLLAASGSLDEYIHLTTGAPIDPFCTLDLQGASETVSLWLLNLLPESWAVYLDKLRCRHGTINMGGSDRVVTYEKVSSMGNGFTFALESLIFFAAVYAARELEAIRKGCPSRDIADLHTEVAIYGDDIVCRRSLYPKVVAILNLLGFKINSEKSFCTGGFRESCGRDYLFGQAVRPIFIQKEITCVTDLFSVHNRLIAWDAQHYYQAFENLPDDFDGHFLRDVLMYLRRFIRPRALRLVGPPNKEVVDENLQLNPFSGLGFAKWCSDTWTWKYPSLSASAVLYESRYRRKKIYGRRDPADGSESYSYTNPHVKHDKERGISSNPLLHLMLNRLAKLPELRGPYDKTPATGCCFDVTRRDSVVYSINYKASTSIWSADRWLADKLAIAR